MGRADSMVAMFGWIMPEPLHIPPTRTGRPPTMASMAVALRTRSVVQMAVAAAFAASSDDSRPETSDGTAARSSGILIRCSPWRDEGRDNTITKTELAHACPITPVDSSSTAVGSIPSARATVSAEVSESCHPASPVAALACSQKPVSPRVFFSGEMISKH